LTGGVSADDARRTSARPSAGIRAALRDLKAPDRRVASSRVGRLHEEEERLSALLLGHARVSTDQQDPTRWLGRPGGRRGPRLRRSRTDGRQPRPAGLRQALAAWRAGDTLVVTNLDRLARSLPDAREILEDLTRRELKLSIGSSVHDPTHPVGRLLFNVLAMVAEFEADLIRLRTKEGMRVATAKGRLRGKQPKAQPATRGAPRHAVPRRRTHGVRAQEAAVAITARTQGSSSGTGIARLACLAILAL
jgi:DNA invertase Pin-like site-specific DNA recombinase